MPDNPSFGLPDFPSFGLIEYIPLFYHERCLIQTSELSNMVFRSLRSFLILSDFIVNICIVNGQLFHDPK